MLTSPPRRRIAVVLASVVLAASAVSVAALTTPASAQPRTQVPADLASANTTAIAGRPGRTVAIAPAQFRRCAEVECADVTVPRDYARPEAGTLTLFVSRRAALRPDMRVGTLFLNPGGPGGPTFDLVRDAERLVSQAVLERFDIIGVDPRGTERSDELTCSARSRGLTRRQLTQTPPEARSIRSNYAVVAQRCAASEGTDLDFMDTETAARDLDAVRASLNEPTLSYLGISYGTYLGAVYSALFPLRTRAAVLDSAIDPNRFGESIILDRFTATETALDAFLAACADGRMNPCNFNDGTDLRAKYDAVRAAAAQQDGGLESLDAQVSDLVGYPRNGWPVLGRALQEAAVGRNANFRQIPSDSQSVREPSTIEPFDTFSTITNLAVNCRDGILPRTIRSYTRVRDSIPQISPRFGSQTRSALAAITCVDWPAAQSAKVTLRPGPATIVIANTFDLTTPLQWSEGLAATLGAPLVVREGGGHGAVDKSSCIRETVSAFLVNGITPQNRATCAELSWT
jgi:pimeloyl-ACP methyl ester carboxylesterase